MRRKQPSTAIRQPTLFDESERIKEYKKQFRCFFPWENVEFTKNAVKLTFSDRKIFKRAELKGSVPILNELKKEFFERLISRALKMYFKDNEFVFEWSSEWKTLTELIEPAIEYYHFHIERVPKTRIGKFAQLNPSQLISLWDHRFEKAKHLKFLAQQHDPAFKIIPVIEYQNGQHEESFIFRRTALSGAILIIWENGNLGRATHLFSAEAQEVDNQVAIIESFIMNDIDAKRTLLDEKSNEAKTIKRRLRFVGSVSHDSNFESNIRHYINKY